MKGTPPTYDPERHLLLSDQAHKRRIHERAEFGEFVRRVKAAQYNPHDPDARMRVFEVLVPDWPPAPRSPLQIIFGGDDPFAGKPWKGKQLAVERDWWSERETFRIAVDMVPHEELDDQYRLAYQWQVPEFDPQQHVLMRHWVNAKGIDIVRFLRSIVPEQGIRLVETTNPHIRGEKAANGGYSPTRRCILLSDLSDVARAAGLEPEEADAAAGTLEVRIESAIRSLDRNDEPLWTKSGKPRVLAIERVLGEDISAAQRDASWRAVEADRTAPPDPEPAAGEASTPVLPEDVKEISPREAIQALEQALGRSFRLFGGQTADRTIMAMGRTALLEWLKTDPTSNAVYVHEKRGRNFDCDDFALALKAALARTRGYNGCAIIWGDAHAWCAFLVEDGGSIEAVMIEPQTDAIVASCTGEYSVGKRCEVYL